MKIRDVTFLVFALLLFSMPSVAFAITCDFGTDIGNYQCRGAIAQASSWTVPADWTSHNTIEVIGGGGAYTALSGGAGGSGGGAYSKISDIALTPGSTIPLYVGAASDTYFNGSSCAGSSVCAKAGAAPSSYAGAAGGSASQGVGSVRYSGGNGAAATGSYGGGGGGAAGPNGNGVSASGATGGAGDAGYGGAGGPMGTCATCTSDGSAGAEYGSIPVSYVSGGTTYTYTLGAGSGGGGGGSGGWYAWGSGQVADAGQGGRYGAGNGGQINDGIGIGNGLSGTGGLIVITYTPNMPPTCSVWFSQNPVPYNYAGTTPIYWTSAVAYNGFSIAHFGSVTPDTTGSSQIPTTATTDYTGTVWNDVGSATCPATLTVTPPPLPSATITAASSSIYTGATTTITATFAAGSGDALTADNIDSPEGTGLGADTNPTTPKSISFTPTTAGTYTFYARAMTDYYTSWASYASTTVTVTDQPVCTPAYTCSSSTIQYTSNHCVVSDVTTCVSPGYCSAGSSLCLYPAPQFNQTTDSYGNTYTGHLQVNPSLVPARSTTTVHWDVSNVSSCTVTGDNGDSWSGASGSQTSSAINQQTIYTLTCAGLDGSTVNESATVDVLPKFQEI